MTDSCHFPGSAGAGRARHLRAVAATGVDGTRRSEGFCDLHLFHRYGAPPQIVVVHHDTAYHRTSPVVTWLVVRSTSDVVAAAAVFLEVLGAAAAQAGAPVRVYDHDPHGNIHSWVPHRPTELTRERLAKADTGRAQW